MNIIIKLQFTHQQMRISKMIISFLLLVFSIQISVAQPREQIVKVIVAPEHQNWIYKVGEKVKFSVSIIQDGNLLKNTNINIKYEVGPEKMKPFKKVSFNLKDGTFVIDGGTMKTPGLLRCIVIAEVNGKQYRSLTTAGFDVEQIQPTIQNPSDFIQFWDQAKIELGKIPIDVRMTLLPERYTENVNVYQVNLQNYRPGYRLYGILCVPKKEGKYPAILKVPGAGIRPFYGDIENAERGIITFEIGIHGIPVNLDMNVYQSLSNGALSGYPNVNLDDRDRYYYKRVYLGCIRANDFLESLPQFDGKNLAVTGGSQGGALAIVTAALDPREKNLTSYYTALSDLTEYLKGRAGGWPHLFAPDNISFNSKKEKIETYGYFDVVNFARLIKMPGMYSWGFNDEVCPPTTSMYAAYNMIKASKIIYLSLESGHWTYPEQTEKLNNRLMKQLKE